MKQPSQTRAKIEVKDLTKKFGELLVLDRINFSINKGELVAIVGPTGCGKTTFLNCMSKLTETTDGDIFIDGVPADPVKHNLAFVFPGTDRPALAHGGGKRGLRDGNQESSREGTSRAP